MGLIVSFCFFKISETLISFKHFKTNIEIKIIAKITNDIFFLINQKKRVLVDRRVKGKEEGG